jgi:hypothetical protein
MKEVDSSGKDLSAEKTSAEQGAWFPQTHEDGQRPQRHQTQTRQRPQSSERVTGKTCFQNGKRMHKRLRQAFACRMFAFLV